MQGGEQARPVRHWRAGLFRLRLIVDGFGVLVDAGVQQHGAASHEYGERDDADQSSAHEPDSRPQMGFGSNRGSIDVGRLAHASPRDLIVPINWPSWLLRDGRDGRSRICTNTTRRRHGPWPKRSILRESCQTTVNFVFSDVPSGPGNAAKMRSVPGRLSWQLGSR